MQRLLRLQGVARKVLGKMLDREGMTREEMVCLLRLASALEPRMAKIRRRHRALHERMTRKSPLM
jgi:hypothetical protein